MERDFGREDHDHFLRQALTTSNSELQEPLSPDYRYVTVTKVTKPIFPDELIEEKDERMGLSSPGGEQPAELQDDDDVYRTVTTTRVTKPRLPVELGEPGGLEKTARPQRSMSSTTELEEEDDDGGSDAEDSQQDTHSVGSIVDDTQAATKIQMQWRAKVSRNKARRLREMKREQLEQEDAQLAAIKIQAQWRSKRARTEVVEKQMELQTSQDKADIRRSIAADTQLSLADFGFGAQLEDNEPIEVASEGSQASDASSEPPGTAGVLAEMGATSPHGWTLPPDELEDSDDEHQEEKSQTRPTTAPKSKDITQLHLNTNDRTYKPHAGAYTPTPVAELEEDPFDIGASLVIPDLPVENLHSAPPPPREPPTVPTIPPPPPPPTSEIFERREKPTENFQQREPPTENIERREPPTDNNNKLKVSKPTNQREQTHESKQPAERREPPTENVERREEPPTEHIERREPPTVEFVEKEIQTETTEPTVKSDACTSPPPQPTPSPPPQLASPLPHNHSDSSCQTDSPLEHGDTDNTNAVAPQRPTQVEQQLQQPQQPTALEQEQQQRHTHQHQQHHVDLVLNDPAVGLTEQNKKALSHNLEIQQLEQQEQNYRKLMMGSLGGLIRIEMETQISNLEDTHRKFLLAWETHERKVIVSKTVLQKQHNWEEAALAIQCSWRQHLARIQSDQLRQKQRKLSLLSSVDTPFARQFNKKHTTDTPSQQQQQQQQQQPKSRKIATPPQSAKTKGSIRKPPVTMRYRHAPPETPDAFTMGLNTSSSSTPASSFPLRSPQTAPTATTKTWEFPHDNPTGMYSTTRVPTKPTPPIATTRESNPNVAMATTVMGKNPTFLPILQQQPGNHGASGGGGGRWSPSTPMTNNSMGSNFILQHLLGTDETQQATMHTPNHPPQPRSAPAAIRPFDHFGSTPHWGTTQHNNSQLEMPPFPTRLIKHPRSKIRPPTAQRHQDDILSRHTGNNNRMLWPSINQQGPSWQHQQPQHNPTYSYTYHNVPPHPPQHPKIQTSSSTVRTPALHTGFTKVPTLVTADMWL